MKKITLTTLAGLLLGYAGLQQARADIITSLVSTTPVSPGVTAFTYRADLTIDQDISSATNAAFGTVYDFGPIIGSITSTGLLTADFTFSTALTNTPAYLTAPVDSPTLLNIRYTANAGVVIGNGATAVALGTFTVDSANSFTTLASYDGQATKVAPGSPGNNTVTGNVGSVPVPSGVPEPASLFTLGSGLLAVGYFGARRRRQV